MSFRSEYIRQFKNSISKEKLLYIVCRLFCFFCDTKSIEASPEAREQEARLEESSSQADE
jgi:hypothetical protein